MWHQWFNCNVVKLREHFLCAKKTKMSGAVECGIYVHISMETNYNKVLHRQNYYCNSLVIHESLCFHSHTYNTSQCRTWRSIPHLSVLLTSIYHLSLSATFHYFSLMCKQRWAQIHQNVFKIKIQNTVWTNVFKYKYKILCGKMYLNTNTVFWKYIWNWPCPVRFVEPCPGPLEEVALVRYT